ncbi:MAG: HAMP domain-containing histidine kinase [Bacteroidales bacterium]|nr:HAMP domain-containing histidine kinase [Bacteroidales bacterium]
MNSIVCRKEDIVEENNSSGMVKKEGNNVLTSAEVLAGMSHELRTHMNAVVAFSYLLNQNGCSSEERQEFANQILSSCEHIINLFDNFLDSLIIDGGNSKTESGGYSLDNIFDSLLSEFRETLRREKFKNLVLVTESQYSGASLEIICDTRKVAKIIRNLFQNAIQNTRSGYIKVGYYYRDGNITFYILDSGSGFQKSVEFLNTHNISESLRKFNDLYTAINLSLTRKLIDLMNGTIWAEKNGMNGTGIYFSIPAIAVNSANINDKNIPNTMMAI